MASALSLDPVSVAGRMGRVPAWAARSLAARASTRSGSQAQFSYTTADECICVYIRIYTCSVAGIAGYAGAYPAYPVAPPLCGIITFAVKFLRSRWGKLLLLLMEYAVDKL